MKHIKSILKLSLLVWIFIFAGTAALQAGQTSVAILGGNTFRDQSGQEVIIKSPFNRIISLYGAHTENLFALGASDQVVGVGLNELHPPEALKKKAFSYRDDAEKFLAARPDLVLVRPMITRAYPGLIARLEQSGIKVVSIQPATMAEMYEYWRILGMLTGRDQEAARMVNAFKTAIADFETLTRSITPKQRVYIEAIHDKMKTFTPDAMAAVVLKLAGGVNVAADAPQVRRTNIAFYGKERILAKGDQIDLYLAQSGAMNKATVEMIRNEPGFQAVKAVRENRIFLIDEAIISRPTPRLLTGIFTMGRMLYPDLFNSKGKAILKRAGLTAEEVPH